MPVVAIHIATGFPILSLTLITEPLRVANRELGREVFSWRIVSESGGAQTSSSGVPVPTRALPDAVPDAALLLASYQPQRSAQDGTLAWLRRLDRQGCLLGCVDTGALVFAKAGLLTTRPAAAHAEAIPGFQRQFPQSLFMDKLWDFAAPRCSSAGGVATLDMTLALIAHATGARVAARVAQILNYTPVVADLPGERLPGALPDPVREAVLIMETQTADPCPISEIARRVGEPDWRLRRLFQTHLHATPQHYYARRRLTRARDMLRNTTLPVGDVAMACGYGNAEAFSRAYRDLFGCAPSRDRTL